LAGFIKKTGVSPEVADLFFTNLGSFDAAFQAYQKDPHFFDDPSSGGNKDMAEFIEQTDVSPRLAHQFFKTFGSFDDALQGWTESPNFSTTKVTMGKKTWQTS
jgi:hypothetical protein